MKHVTRLKTIREVETLPLLSSSPPLHYSPITFTSTRFCRPPSNSP
jgi:hypothetical protein